MSGANRVPRASGRFGQERSPPVVGNRRRVRRGRTRRAAASTSRMSLVHRLEPGELLADRLQRAVVQVERHRHRQAELELEVVEVVQVSANAAGRAFPCRRPSAPPPTPTGPPGPRGCSARRSIAVRPATLGRSDCWPPSRNAWYSLSNCVRESMFRCVLAITAVAQDRGQEPDRRGGEVAADAAAQVDREPGEAVRVVRVARRRPPGRRRTACGTGRTNGWRTARSARPA